MKHKMENAGIKGKPYDLYNDFKVLTREERQRILKTAGTLEKVQAENLSMLAAAHSPPFHLRQRVCKR